MIIDNCSSTHVAFSDEAYWNIGRFRSLAIASCRNSDYIDVSKELDQICNEHHTEIKWSKITYNAGKKFIDCTFNNLHRVRIDIMIYDMSDSRHYGVKRRDDAQNMQRLYYRLIHHIMRISWPNHASWSWFPDDHSCIEWDTIKHYLESSSWGVDNNYLFNSPTKISFYKMYDINEISPVDSADHSFAQLADFFAGLAAYSYLSYNKVRLWDEEKSGQMTIFDNEPHGITLSNQDNERLPLVWDVYNKSKKRSLGVSLRSSPGLCSQKNRSNLNFWLYRPQHEADKAPQKTHK